MFEHVPPYAGDPILTLNEAFQVDPRPDRVNLSIGIYFDEAGRIPFLRVLRDVEAELLANSPPRSYLPMEGDARYRAGVQALVFGDDSPVLAEQRVATIQTLGGSGALKVGADFLRRTLPSAEVWVSGPTWDNHRAIFEGAGFTVNTYPYYDAASGTVDAEGMLAALETLPAQSIVVLHACCHNPTGVDLTPEQWAPVIDVLRRRNLLPFVDMAYQGFGDDLDADAAPIRRLVAAGVPVLVASSFSKNMSLYGERCGSLSVVCDDAAQAARVLGQLQVAVRRNYSSPPTHAARLVVGVLSSAERRQAWAAELAVMRERMVAMREGLATALQAQGVPAEEADRFRRQRGMFSYTGLTSAEVDRLREEQGVYLVGSGRMCVAGLNPGNLERASDALAAVLKQRA